MNSITTIPIGIAPTDEECAQTGIHARYQDLQLLECRVYRAAIIARYGPPPSGARLRVRTWQHDFGTYKELCIELEDGNEAAAEWANRAQGGIGRWSDVFMTAPVAYWHPDQPRIDIPSEQEAVAWALRLILRLREMGHGVPEDVAIERNLRTAYPTESAQVPAPLARLALSSETMGDK